MGVTNYDTIGSSILGENTSGAQTDYLSDALGSVSATLNSSGTVGNTYEYAPYGSQISKTGTSSDPDFRWVGSMGYRATGLQYASHYVRARTYDESAGRWIAVDLLWPTFGAYTYGFAEPLRITDPSGMDPTRKNLNSTCGSCAQFLAQWLFSFQDHGANGVLIQQVKVHFAQVDTCPGGPCTSWNCFQCNQDFVYYEAWVVQNGFTLDPTYSCGGWSPPTKKVPENDDWSHNPQAGTYGSITMTGTIMFVSNGSVPPTWCPPQEACSQWLPSGYSYTNFAGTEPGMLVYNWACCPTCAKNPPSNCPHSQTATGPCQKAEMTVTPAPPKGQPTCI